ncbi:MAG: glycerate kinase [Candidatus Competibacteraceae bacterium]|nr:glycerate kinase [Candidatus Competibacteraceae bacterium]
MRIVISPDSYKGSVAALSVAQAIERGIQRVFRDAEIFKTPIADGGEGTVEALVAATSGTFCQTAVTGPLGEIVSAQWGILGDGATAVIEMAAASGLPLVPPAQRDPRLTTSRGTGELIRTALDHGLRHLIIGIGGSATNDGGAGMAEALGVRCLDAAGEPLPPGGAALSRLAAIDLSGLDQRLRETQIQTACDVDNPLCGPCGASAVYGPQKGATPAMVIELDHALRHYGRIAAQTFGRDVTEQPGAGAAGGLGAALLWFTNARLQPGIEIVIAATGLRDLIRRADWVITGEGATDYQTAFGKAPAGIAKVAQEFGVPVVCLSGGLGRDYQAIYASGIDAAASTTPRPMTLEDCLAAGPALIEDAAERLARLIAVGIRIAPCMIV